MRIVVRLAHVAELADAYGSGPYGATRGGSSPLVSKPDRRQLLSEEMLVSIDRFSPFRVN
jgi:hypothetical protein